MVLRGITEVIKLEKREGKGAGMGPPNHEEPQPTLRVRPSPRGKGGEETHEEL